MSRDDNPLLIRPDRDKLGELHSRFRAGDITDYVIVSVASDGTTTVDFDLGNVENPVVCNKIGGGLAQAFSHVRDMTLQEAMKRKIAEGAKKMN